MFTLRHRRKTQNALVTKNEAIDIQPSVEILTPVSNLRDFSYTMR